MVTVWRVETIDDWGLPQDGGSRVTPDEPLGTKSKFWVNAPDGTEFLFKYAREHQGHTAGEDWAEWVVHRLAGLLAIPTAVAIPARHEGRRGILSRSVLSSGEQLIHGNELLALIDPDYDTEIIGENNRYTVEAVFNALDGIAAPTSVSSPVLTAFDAWSGYAMLDAWVAGCDRHHENWAVIKKDGSLRLAPSFDHGNALGFQVRENTIQTLITSSSDLSRWARRGRSRQFRGKPALIELARASLQLVGSDTRTHWLDRLAAVSTSDIESILCEVPYDYLSVAGRSFRAQLLHLNRERILSGD